MYNERRETFSFRSFFLTLLLLVLFILLMLFLFPTRWEFKKGCKGCNAKQVEVINDEMFTNNLNKMKDVARGYYTTDKLPTKENETKKMTLKEMYNKHLILKVKDKDGKECNSDKSYTEITKTSEGYKLKVNLSCGKQEDYIIVNLSDYSTCTSNTCATKTETKTNATTNTKTNTNTSVSKSTTTTTTNTNTTKTEVVQTQPTKVAVTGISVSVPSVTLNVGELIKVTATITPSNATNTNTVWSNSNSKVAKISNKVITALSAGTTTITVKTADGGKTATIKVTVIDPNAKTNTSTNTKTNTTTNTSTNTGTSTGTKTETKTNTGTSTGTKTETKTEQKPTQTVTYKCKIVSGKYYDSTGKVVSKDAYNKSCLVLYYEYSKKVPQNTSYGAFSELQKEKIEGSEKVTSTGKIIIDVRKQIVQEPYEAVIGYKEDVATVARSTRTGKSSYIPSNKTTDCCEVKYENVKKLDNGLYSWTEVTYTIVYKSTPITETRYRDVTYYKSRTITITNAYTITEWRKSKNDTSLLNAGYELTGKTEYRQK